MQDDVTIKVEQVSKKYCKTLKRSMFYGIQDIMRNSLGMRSNSNHLRRDEFWAVSNVSFEVKKGETLGIIGPNGCGKSTLLKMLNGIFWPDKGKISIKGRMGALIEIGAGFHPLLTGRENIYVNAAILGMKKEEVDAKFEDIVTFADIGDFIDAPVKHYSSGMYVKLGFSIAVHSDPDILLVDEVLAVGDAGFQNKCFNKIGKLKEQGTTTILVSHNMHAISNFSNKVLLLTAGKANYFDDVSEGVMQYNKLFTNSEKIEIEKISDGNDNIQFYDIDFKKNRFNPGDSFTLFMKYNSLVDYQEVIIDTVIFNMREEGMYFQATNKAYNKVINLKKGKNSLKVSIDDIRLNDTTAKIAISIWSKDHIEKLFWMRFPIEFKGVSYSTGRTFLNVSYENA